MPAAQISGNKSVEKRARWRRRFKRLAEEISGLLLLLLPAAFVYSYERNRHVLLLVMVAAGVVGWLIVRVNLDKAFWQVPSGMLFPIEIRDHVKELGDRIGAKMYGLVLERGHFFQVKEPEPPRYTDLTFYEGHVFSSDLKTARRLPDGRPLAVGEPYTLEVAIRLKRTGIDAEKEPGPPVENPRRDKEKLTIYVLARSQRPEIIEMIDWFRDIQWPYNEDSESALFRLDVKAAFFAHAAADREIEADGAPRIEVRVFDGNLDLLDIVEVLVPTKHPLRLTRYLVWPEKKTGVLLIDRNSPLRRLSVDVSIDSASQKYCFLFKFLRKSGEEVKIPGSTTVSAKEIENLLVRIRNFWTELVTTNYEAALSVSPPPFRKYLDDLRILGMEAWSLLFGYGFADQAGASESIGKLLEKLQLDDGAHIQIVHGNLKNLNFVFPWSIVHPPDADENTVDPLQFWGVRYQIEQVTDGPEYCGLDEVPIGVVFALDQNFGNADSQRELLKRYEAAAADKLFVTDPISDQRTLFTELVRVPPAHLVYFYCHGYDPGAGISRLDGGVLELRKRTAKLIDELPEDSPRRKELQTLLDLTAKKDDEAWMYIGGAQIRESRIKWKNFFDPMRRPIVFLNMCQSAELIPSMSSGFVRLFLLKNASAVLGTECPMTEVFAHEFAKIVFDALFGGDDIGTALWKARRHFLTGDIRNPLGLAYTLYGRAVARLGAGAVITTPASPAANN